MRNKSRLPINNSDLEGNKSKHQFVAGLSEQTKEALQRANAAIEEQMISIMSAYPTGKKNTFFKLKMGVNTEKIKLMAIKEIFVLLNLKPANISHFRLVENLDVNGKIVEPQSR
ncbi:MAG: hypothetical protein ACKE51_08410 [Methylococcaceae bacterium]